MITTEKPLKKKAKAPSYRKQRVGVIGWLYPIDEEYGKTTAICDINPASIERYLQAHPEAKSFTDYRKMADAGELDVVAIATPNQLHLEMAEYFLKKGVHVFLEKPMGVNMKEVDALLKTQQKSGKHLAIDFEYRASFFAKRIQEIINKGEIGKPVNVDMTHYRGGWLAQGNGMWRLDPKLSGGLYFMEPCHQIDFFRSWFGEISAVQSFSAPNVLPQYPADMPDNICTHLWFENGMTGTIIQKHTCSVFNAKAPNYSNFGHEMYCIITGTQGAIRIDFITKKILICRYAEFHPDAKRGVRVELNRVEDYSSMTMNEFCHDCLGNLKLFIKHMAQGIPPHQDAADARITHLIGIEAERSALEGSKKITINTKLP